MGEIKNSLEFKITGMTCTACSSRLQRVLNKLADVNVEVNFATESANVNLLKPENDINKITAEVVDAVAAAGFSAELIDNTKNINLEEKNNREFWHFVGAAIFSAPLLLPMLPMLLGWLGLISGHYHDQLMPTPFWQFVFASIVQFIFGARFYKSGYLAVASGAANMDTLVALGTSTAYLLSLVVWLFDIHFAGLYFEASAGIITFVLLGKALEAKAKKNSQSALNSLINLKPTKAFKILNFNIQGLEKLIEVSANELKIADVILIKSGESIPADGEIIEGESVINQAMLTGEAIPVHKSVGEKVFAATINNQGVLKVRVCQNPENSFLSKIINMVRLAQGSKAHIQKFADKIAAIFVPTVILISGLTFISWIIAGQFGVMSFANLETNGVNIFLMALINAAGVLVIACPCAVGLATPMAVVVAIGKAAQMGILVRDFNTFEKLIKINRVVYDKTGTLTQGNPRIEFINIINSALNENEIIQLIATLEQGSSHPLAKAINQEIINRKLKIDVGTEIIGQAGLGIMGKIDGQKYFCGSQKYIKQQNIDIKSYEPQNHQNQMGLLFFADENKLLAVVGFNDPLRETSAEVVWAWAKRRILQSILSGDRQVVVESIIPQKLRANFAEINCELMPEDKQSKIHEYQKNGEKVLMIGDGINDAPALASADVSIAIGSGSETAIATADITLLKNDLAQAIDVYDLAHASFRVIKRNLFFAFIFNAIGIPLAALGIISPLLAGLMMVMSSLSVVSSSLLLKLWQPTK